jgi:Cu/Ag efflux pump CusA
MCRTILKSHSEECLCLQPLKEGNDFPSGSGMPASGGTILLMIEGILISTPTGAQIPLGQIAEITYRQGPSMIRGENSFLVGFVLLDKQPGYAEVTVVEDAQRYLQER